MEIVNILINPNLNLNNKYPKSKFFYVYSNCSQYKYIELCNYIKLLQIKIFFVIIMKNEDFMESYKARCALLLLSH